MRKYARWLHTRWPAGKVDPLPSVGEGGTTSIPGVRIVGDLTGIPLLKFSSQSGADAIQAILREPDFQTNPNPDIADIAIAGAGAAGVSAAMEAKKAGLTFRVLDGAGPFSTVVNFPKAKPIFTYPSDMTPSGGLQYEAEVKEDLLDEMERQRVEAGIDVIPAHVDRIEREGSTLLLRHENGEVTRARRVILAIGRSGEYRKIGCPGEELDKVYNRLHDPKDFQGKDALVVGGGDSAVETAIALSEAGARVTLAFRTPELSRPKSENLERLAAAVGVRLLPGSTVDRIEPESVIVSGTSIPNDVVFTMIGRDAPLAFLRRSGIAIRGEWTPRRIAGFLAFFAFCWFLYLWKAGGSVTQIFQQRSWFPFNIETALVDAATRPETLWGTLAIDLGQPGFYYALVYSALIVVFGWKRIRKRRTPYVRVQTLSLIAFQVIPLFLLPYIVLPWMGHNGWFDSGAMKYAADQLFPEVDYEHGREYWRAFGLILAWPLFLWNVFTAEPLWWWLSISFLQTFVIIPLILYRWGKGAYCGWICSCGGLAETMGDSHREKMPHGPIWNRVNFLGQAILAAGFVLLALRAVSWTWPQSAIGKKAALWFGGMLSNWSVMGVQLNYYHLVDIFLAGIVGVGFYFWFSGRVWCRFACPLAALMHIYTRFSRFRIFAEKKKCISCNVCTSVCHQGIDVMNFANKGLPMEDPQCVRCSACVQMCPTGVLSFGRYGSNGLVILDQLPARNVK